MCVARSYQECGKESLTTAIPSDRGGGGRYCMYVSLFTPGCLLSPVEWMVRWVRVYDSFFRGWRTARAIYPSPPHLPPISVLAPHPSRTSHPRHASPTLPFQIHPLPHPAHTAVPHPLHLATDMGSPETKLSKNQKRHVSTPPHYFGSNVAQELTEEVFV